MSKELWGKCVEFHGHECPGLAIGFKATLGAIEELNLNFSEDEELVCITECTMGKGNLIYKGTGKMAFTFINRNDNRSVRLMLNQFKNDMDQERQDFLLESDYKDIFKITYPQIKAPEKAHIFRTIICHECGEGTPEHKMRLVDGNMICLDCFKPYTRGWDNTSIF